MDEMTRGRLRQYESLQAECEEAFARMIAAESRRAQIEETLGCGDVLGAFSEMERQRERCAADMARCEIECEKIAAYIDRVPDSLTRRALRLRYVDGLPWAAVAARLGYASESGARSLVERYLAGGEK